MISSNDQISVIITTHNRQELVQRAIQSVLNQSRQPDEIILIDDGSTDDTEKIIHQTFPSVNYIRQSHQGISQARNRGIDQASCNWITFLDSDDEWLPDKLNKQMEKLNEKPEYRICYTNEIWIRRGVRVNPKKSHQKFGGDIFSKCLPLCIISPSSVIIHRFLFDEYGYFDPSLPVCEDYDLWLRLCAFLPVLYIEEPLIVKYGGHSDQLSRKYWGMDRYRIAALEKIIQNSRLDDQKRRAAIKMLLKKINIYLLGAEKRKKDDDIVHYNRKRDRYQIMLNTLKDADVIK